MAGNRHGSSIRIDVTAVGMLFILLALVVALFALAEMRLPGATPSPMTGVRDQALFVLAATLLVVGVGLLRESPWAWLPAVAFCALLVSVSPWAALALAYVPWMLLQADTRELFLDAPRRRFRENARDVGISTVLSVVQAVAMSVAPAGPLSLAAGRPAASTWRPAAPASGLPGPTPWPPHTQGPSSSHPIPSAAEGS